VGSKNFTEQELLGEIVAQAAERAGIRVDRKLALGGTLLAHEALVKGDLDVYPEYTGTALTAVLKAKPVNDAAVAFQQVRDAYAQRWHLVWLRPLGFNNTFAMVVRGDQARAGGLKTLSDAARAQPWTLGMGYEFRQRPDGLDGLLRTYSLRQAGDPVTMDLGLLYTALESKKVDMVAANSTDGQLSKLDAKILEDDKHYFPPYQCALIVRPEAFTHFPALRPALAQLSGKIDDAAMRALNYQVDAEHRSIHDVAAGFLANLSH
jgi:glycine betaine/choline ABC-type transport system substrate-binding protein